MKPKENKRGNSPKTSTNAANHGSHAHVEVGLLPLIVHIEAGANLPMTGMKRRPRSADLRDNHREGAQGPRSRTGRLQTRRLGSDGRFGSGAEAHGRSSGGPERRVADNRRASVGLLRGDGARLRRGGSDLKVAPRGWSIREGRDG